MSSEAACARSSKRQPWTWFMKMGRVPSHEAKRWRFSSTSGSRSPTCKPRFMASKGEADAPPSRLVQTARTLGGAGQSGTSQLLGQAPGSAMPILRAHCRHAPGRVLQQPPDHCSVRVQRPYADKSGFCWHALSIPQPCPRFGLRQPEALDFALHHGEPHDPRTRRYPHQAGGKSQF